MWGEGGEGFLATRLQRQAASAAYRSRLRDFIVSTPHHLKPSGRYGIEWRLVTAHGCEEACEMSGLDQTMELVAFDIPSEAEYHAALMAEDATDLSATYRTG